VCITSPFQETSPHAFSVELIHGSSKIIRADPWPQEIFLSAAEDVASWRPNLPEESLSLDKALGRGAEGADEVNDDPDADVGKAGSGFTSAPTAPGAEVGCAFVPLSLARALVEAIDDQTAIDLLKVPPKTRFILPLDRTFA
jgi:hypothetical protein